MNKELFASMRAQMAPSPEARAALGEKLVQAGPGKRPVPWKRYAALAACAVLVISAVPLSRYWKWRKISDNFQPCDVGALEPHSYVLTDGAGIQTESTAAGGIDTAASPEPSAGTEDIPAYVTDVLRPDAGGGEPAVNTGDLPGGAYVSDVPVQEAAAMAYQNLMAQFEKDYGPDKYPEWYGGAYINEYEVLVVNIAEDFEPEDKNLFLKIQDWAGTDQISFGSVKYGLGYLRKLRDRAFEAMDELGLAAGGGINEEKGRVELDLSAVTEEALLILAELDPADDAILVQVGQQTAVQDVMVEETAAGDESGGYVHIPAPAENDAQPENIPAAPDGAGYGLLPLEPSGVEDAAPGE